MTRQVNSPFPGAAPVDPRLFLRDSELDRGIALVAGAGQALGRAADAARAAAGLSQAEADILLTLRYTPGIEVTALRERLGQTQPTFARHLGALDKAGLVAKARGLRDARRRRLSLSEKGLAATDGMAEALRDAMRRAFREAGADKVDGARIVLEALTK